MLHIQLVFIVCNNVDFKIVMNLLCPFNLYIVCKFVSKPVDIFVNQSNDVIGLLGRSRSMEGQDFFMHVKFVDLRHFISFYFIIT
jgi:hypothetical protein